MRPPAVLVLLFASLAPAALPADAPDRDTETARAMLAPVKERLREDYYDPAFTGVDFEGIFREAEKQMASTRTPSDAFILIARAVQALGDSHTSFVPPPRPMRIRYGWALHSIGQNVYVQAVEAGSDAEKQGVKAGERVLDINGLPVDREGLRWIRFLLKGLNPQSVLQVRLQPADGPPRVVQFAPSIKREARNVTRQSAEALQKTLYAEEEAGKGRSRFAELAPGVLFWKLAGFSDDVDLTAGLRKCAAANQVILDLRDNPGGGESLMLDAIGAFFPAKIKVGTLKKRGRSDDLTASSIHAIKARLYVLVNAGSASAAEVLARTMQLEGRATVLGDRSAGRVNRGEFSVLTTGAIDQVVPFGVSVTTAALIMPDGKPLENTGVTPDVWLVPSPKDIAAGNDPVLATAAKMAGVALDKVAAGQLSRAARQPLFD